MSKEGLISINYDEDIVEATVVAETEKSIFNGIEVSDFSGARHHVSRFNKDVLPKAKPKRSAKRIFTTKNAGKSSLITHRLDKHQVRSIW